ncbi:hypothetical protein J4E81_007017 [Alternaria sp. BMP 2799]|nr:hypothetical protein J4E81_007017 [Alternaria sp. BMP 2799]
MDGPSAACSFEDLIQSKLFTFYIGKEKKEFVIHSKAVAANSWHFHALVNNGMIQSQESSVEYPDMEPDDFARFVEYSYRFDYTTPSWVQDDKVAQSDNKEGTAHNDEDPDPISSRSPGGAKGAKMKAGSNSTTRPLRQRFHQREYLMPQEPKTIMLDRFEPTENSVPEQDFTPIFLAHARLYTFACMRLIDPLKRLALHKLHQTLLKFKLYDRRVGDVVELARYAYDNGEDRKPDGTIEDLRKLVVEYIACEVSTIGKHEAFAPLLQEGGEFVVDFWRIIAKENLSL